MRRNLRIRDPEQVVQEELPELILSDDCRTEVPSVEPPKPARSVR